MMVKTACHASSFMQLYPAASDVNAVSTSRHEGT